MDLNHPVNAHPKKSGVRRFCVIISIVFTLIILLVALLPTILSTGYARTRIIGMINNAMSPAVISVDKWDLSWRRQQTIQGITYTDSKQGVTANVKEIKIGSLWSILPIGKLTAEIEVVEPEVSLLSLILPPAESIADPTERTSKLVKSERAPILLPAWEMALHLKITDAKVNCAELPQPIVQNGNVEVVMASTDDPIVTTLSATLLAEAPLTANITVAPLKTLVSDGVSAKSVQALNVKTDSTWLQLLLDAHLSEQYEFPKTTLQLNVQTEKLFALIQPFKIAPTELTALSGQLLFAVNAVPEDGKRLRMACTLQTPGISYTFAQKTQTLEPTISLDVMLNCANPMESVIHKLQATLPGIHVKGEGTLANGTVNATVKTSDCWKLAQPYLGDFPLAEHLMVDLSLKAISETFSGKLNLMTHEKTIGETSLMIDGLDLATMAFRSLKLNSKWSVAQLIKVGVKLPDTIATDGDFYFNLAAIGSVNNLKANLAFTLQNVKLNATSWNVAENVILDGSAMLTLKDKVCSAEQITLTTPLFSTKGRAVAAFGKTPQLTATLSGKVTPQRLFGKWRVWGKDETPFQINGEIDYDLALQAQEGKLDVAVKATSEDVTFQPKCGDKIKLPLTIESELHYADNMLQLGKGDLLVLGQGVKAKGTFDVSSGILSLNGSITPDFDLLMVDLPSLSNVRDIFSISGNITRDFTFQAPITTGLPGIINYGSATATLAFDTIKVPGASIANGELALILKDGTVSLDGDYLLNNGTLALHPRFSFSGNDLVMTWKRNSKILDNVALTQELFDALLGQLNPLLNGAAEPSGMVSLICEILYLPITGKMPDTLNMNASIITDGCQLQPNGTLKKVLTLVAKQDDCVRLEDQTFRIKVEDGILSTEPLAFRVERLRLKCEGTTNLMTKDIHFTLSIPMDEALLGKSLAKSFKEDEMLKLPVIGTLNKPRIDLSPLKQALTKATATQVKQKANKKLTKKLNKVLNKRGKVTDTETIENAVDSAEDLLDNALRGLFGD